MTYVIHANLDCEATWAGITLPKAVRERISLLGTLMVALAPPDAEVELWTPAPVDPARLATCTLTLRVGVPARADLRWADPDARAANDRRLALAAFPLDGAAVVTSLAELDARVAATPGRWVCKAPWTAAGRDRAFGEGPPPADTRTYLGRMIDRFGGVCFEPWLERVADAGMCAGSPPHGIVTDARGSFRGISPDHGLTPDEARELASAGARASGVLAGAGYHGPFTVDAFAYRVGGERRFRPVCEINARLSFGVIARALGGTLGFGAAPPRARTLIALGDDGVTAWAMSDRGVTD